MSGLTPDAGKYLTCKHLMRGAPDCVFCHRDELEKEVQRLQKALHFWLPHVPAEGPEEIAQRCGDDAMLLVGYDPTQDEPDAEARGWIELCVPAQIRQLCPECLGYMPCAQHPSRDGTQQQK